MNWMTRSLILGSSTTTGHFSGSRGRSAVLIQAVAYGERWQEILGGVEGQYPFGISSGMLGLGLLGCRHSIPGRGVWPTWRGRIASQGEVGPPDGRARRLSDSS